VGDSDFGDEKCRLQLALARAIFGFNGGKNRKNRKIILWRKVGSKIGNFCRKKRN